MKEKQLLSLEPFTGVWKADLHVHSSVSPCGKHSIREIFQKAQEQQLQVIGIADHFVEERKSALLARPRLGATSDRLRILYGVETDFYEPKETDIEVEILAKLDFVSGAIHWLKNMPVNFFPEMLPENRVRQLQPHQLISSIQEQLKLLDKNDFLDVYVETIHALLKSKRVSIWAHPLRTVGFCLIFGWDLIPLLRRRYLDGILESMCGHEKVFELNEGLYSSLKYRGGPYFFDVCHRFDELYQEILQKVYKRQIPLTIGTDAHSVDKIGHYSWIREHIRNLNCSEICFVVPDLK